MVMYTLLFYGVHKIVKQIISFEVYLYPLS